MLVRLPARLRLSPLHRRNVGVARLRRLTLTLTVTLTNFGQICKRTASRMKDRESGVLANWVLEEQQSRQHHRNKKRYCAKMLRIPRAGLTSSFGLVQALQAPWSASWPRSAPMRERQIPNYSRVSSDGGRRLWRTEEEPSDRGQRVG